MQTAISERRAPFRPRFSLLTVLLVMALAACGLTIWQLWREVGPLRTENKRLNEERGTLVISDANQLHAIKIPARFAGEGRESFRVYVPPGQSYIAFLRVNGIPKAGLPERKKLSDYAGILGGSEGRLFGELRSGEHIVTVNTVRLGSKSDIALVVDSLDASANTTNAQWPTTKPETYTVFHDGVDRTTVAAGGTEPLVLLRQRIMGVARETVHVSYVTPIIEPDVPLDGVLLWVERTK